MAPGRSQALLRRALLARRAPWWPAPSGTASVMTTATTPRRHRALSTAALGSSGQGNDDTPESLAVPLAGPTVCIWGANTGVGKTIVSAGLAHAAAEAGRPLLYVKPVQTGYPADSDERLVAGAAALADAAATASSSSGPPPPSTFRTLYAYRDPVSPHLAAAREGLPPVPDAEVARAVARELRAFALLEGAAAGAGVSAAVRPPPAPSSPSSSSPCPLSIVETAGGVLSPGVSGAPQADVLRPLRLPALLVGDARLGGISATLCAYESLALRGHDVAAVVLLEREGEERGESGGNNDSNTNSSSLGNAAALRAALSEAAAHRLGEPLPVLTLPPVPPPPPPTGGEGGRPADEQGGSAAGAVDAGVHAWLREAGPRLRALLQELDAAHARRLRDLRTSAARASACVWWPFTQHGALPVAAGGSGGVTVVDGRAGEDWLVFRDTDNSNNNNDSSSPSLRPAYDAASSWWTQVASGPRAQAEVTRALASAAGRYAHVMWPQVAHAPGLRLAEELVQGPLGRGWASRCFFSDDGSTGVEVALKAAMRRFALDQGLGRALWPDEVDEDTDDSSSSSPPPELPELGVLALANGYHGDTLGAMDCAAPSAFNGPGQFPWYRGGSGGSLFLEPPYVAMEDGRWVARLPEWLQQVAEDEDEGEGDSGSGSGDGDGSTNQDLEWATRAELFDLPRRARSRLARRYARSVVRAMDAHEEGQGAEEEDEKSGSSRSAEQRPRRRRNKLLAAVLLEPVLQGAGGMLMVDPLFQAVLAREARRTRGLPLVYDEVFSGCWRLGVPRAADLLRLEGGGSGGGGGGGGGVDSATKNVGEDHPDRHKDPSLPDVAVYAKLLTGGAAPLAATLASERVFAAFSHASSLARALLHGHSYTAYPAGCAAALASLHVINSPSLNPNVCAPPPREEGEEKQLGSSTNGGSGASCRRSDGNNGCSCPAPCGRLLDLWSEADASELSRHRLVRRVVAIGTVLAVEVRSAADAAAPLSASASSSSYTSGRSASAAVVEAMRARGFAARPLGPVVYVVATPTAPLEACARAVGELRAALDDVLRPAEASVGGRGGSGLAPTTATAACLV